MLFNSLVLDMHPYVGDESFATNDGLFGKRLVAGAQVFAYGLGLMANNNVHAFSYGYDKLRFIKPVFIGDTLRVRWALTSKRESGSKPGMGIIHEWCRLVNQSGTTVQEGEHITLLRKRPQ